MSKQAELLQEMIDNVSGRIEMKQSARLDAVERVNELTESMHKSYESELELMGQKYSLELQLADEKRLEGVL